jgi:hypothetical protein|tara:strand:- start:43 stop:234 length:192 start_codon:yes stop_codon:yes gene_type:complete
MWRWIKKLGSTVGIGIAVIGIGGVRNDFAGWREWIDALPPVIYPQGVLILGGIALLIAANVPS